MRTSQYGRQSAAPQSRAGLWIRAGDVSSFSNPLLPFLSAKSEKWDSGLENRRRRDQHQRKKRGTPPPAAYPELAGHPMPATCGIDGTTDTGSINNPTEHPSGGFRRRRSVENYRAHRRKTLLDRPRRYRYPTRRRETCDESYALTSPLASSIRARPHTSTPRSTPCPNTSPSIAATFTRSPL